MNSDPRLDLKRRRNFLLKSLNGVGMGLKHIVWRCLPIERPTSITSKYQKRNEIRIRSLKSFYRQKWIFHLSKSSQSTCRTQKIWSCRPRWIYSNIQISSVPVNFCIKSEVKRYSCENGIHSLFLDWKHFHRYYQNSVQCVQLKTLNIAVVP